MTTAEFERLAECDPGRPGVSVLRYRRPYVKRGLRR